MFRFAHYAVSYYNMLPQRVCTGGQAVQCAPLSFDELESASS